MDKLKRILNSYYCELHVSGGTIYIVNELIDGSITYQMANGRVGGLGWFRCIDAREFKERFAIDINDYK